MKERKAFGKSVFDFQNTRFVLADLATRLQVGWAHIDWALGKLVKGDLTTAQRVVRKAIKSVSQLRGRLGSFQQNTIGATIRSLGVSLENTTAAESAIRDTDFASESAQLTRNQILVSASTSTLAIANSQPQNVLQLLG